MVGFNADEFVDARESAQAWIDDTMDIARVLIWENGPPPGYTVMTEEEEQAVMEEFSLLAARGGRPARELVQHPVVRERISELEQKARDAQAAPELQTEMP